jgi:hypothetical protein
VVQSCAPVYPAYEQAQAGAIPQAGVYAQTAMRNRDPVPKLHGCAIIEAHQSVGAHACKHQAICAVLQVVHRPPCVAPLGGGGDTVLPPRHPFEGGPE